VIQALSVELAAATESQLETIEAATHEEARPENDKDTRALETSYLARGQARRVAQLEDELTLLRALRPRTLGENDVIGAGALVAVEYAEGTRELFLLLPGGGGQSLQVQGATVRTITGRAPIGRALIGARVGDDVEVQAPDGTRELSVLEVV
jgi:transcription elongation GreA/GreB family factor